MRGVFLRKLRGWLSVMTNATRKWVISSAAVFCFVALLGGSSVAEEPSICERYPVPEGGEPVSFKVKHTDHWDDRSLSDTEGGGAVVNPDAKSTQLTAEESAELAKCPGRERGEPFSVHDKWPEHGEARDDG